MKRRTIALICVWTLPSLIFLAVTWAVYSAFRIPPAARLDAAEQAAVIAPLRAVLAARPPAPCTVHRPLAGPLAVTVWLDGRSVVRVDGSGPDVGAATDDAVAKLGANPALRRIGTPDLVRARLEVDIVTGMGPLAGGNLFLDSLAVPGIAEMLAIDPGIDGVGADIDGKQALLLPHELVAAKVLSMKRPSDAMPDFAMGVDLARIGLMLNQRVGKMGIAPTVLYRFHTDAFVEGADHASVLSLYRGAPARPSLSAKSLREAALAGGRYLVEHLAVNGRYVYEHDLTTGVMTDPLHSPNYSMPRHAGTTYFLAQLYRITKAGWLREPIERAFKHLADLMAGGRCNWKLPDGTDIDCVIDKNESKAQLGSTALTVVALAEYQRATGDARYLPVATKLAAFVLWMQRPDGSFRHLYDPKTHQPDDATELLYYSGEASLALARMYEVTKDTRYGEGARKGLDWLVDWYDFFMGGFFFGEEHWTCISAEAIWPYGKRDAYRSFCDDYGTFLRSQQIEPGEQPDEDDWQGAYDMTPFVAPFNTPSGSRTEAMISAYQLDRDHGEENPALRAQIRDALAYLLGQQLRPDNDFDAVGSADGGIPGSPIDRSVRIDFVQHVCSAMLRASEWIDEP